MRALSAEDLLRAAEWLRGESQPRRAAILLALAEGGPVDEAMDLSVGERDGRLVALRTATFGGELTGTVDCPACGERCEITLDAAALRALRPSASEVEASSGERFVHARLPNGHDLVAALGAADPRRALLQRCVVDEVSELPDDLVDALEQAMERADPRADIRLALTCPACGSAWETLFDIVSFLAAEVRAAAERLTRDVHVLASAYGWREADILAMSAWRRQTYIDLVTA